MRILLVDDHAILRRGLALMLGSLPAMSIVGEAGTAAEAERLAKELEPDVVVMDVALPDFDGATATRQILAALPGMRVLALSAFSDRRHVLDTMQAGAIGYVIKDCVLEELVTAIQHVAAGKRYLGSGIALTLLNTLPANLSGTASSKLTGRETEVLQLLAEGRAMKQAASDLQISTKTVETHRRAIMEKLQLFSVAELTKHAIRTGLVTLD
jgi:DNA-binding NarL/FixJ family response regulator